MNSSTGDSLPESTTNPAEENVPAAAETNPPAGTPEASSEMPAEQSPPVAEDTGANESHVASPNPPSSSHPPGPASPAIERSVGLPGLRVQIGSLGDPNVARDVKARPNVSGSNVEASSAAASEDAGSISTAPKPAAPKQYPPPKLSRQMTPELEAEIQDALGGMSLDDVLGGKTSATVGADLEPETKVTGRVVSLHRENVLFELGGRNQGVASLRLFPEPPEPGTAVELIVSRLNAEDGLYELTLPGAAVDVGNWSEVQEGIVVQAVVTGHNKGGLECQVSSIRGFMPVSQIALYRVEDLEQFVGQSFPALVTEANADRRNLVLSRRAVLEREQEENKRKKLEELAVGQTHEGIVRSLQPFGAFVDLGGVDGLIHVSQMSWDRVNHPSEVLQLGQKVRVRIEKYDRATGKIGLSYRDSAENPWNNVIAKYPVGTRVEGRVSKIMQFGAFVRLEAGVEGLIHISELSYQRVHRVSDMLKEGQEVEVQILSVDLAAQRISLSLKALEAKPTQVDKEQARLEQAMDELEAAGPAKKKSAGPLKGGTGKPSGGEKFGLNW